MDINRFTEKSREALTTAQGLAAQYGHQEVDAEHLALALVNQEDGFVPRVLERVGVAPKAPGPRTEGRFFRTASSAVTSALGATPTRSRTRGTKPSS